MTMGSLPNDQTTPAPTTFPIITSIPTDETEVARNPPFSVSLAQGFLPLTAPLADLPAAFTPLTTILEEMPIRKLDGSPGLLASFSLGQAVLNDLPDLSSEVEEAVQGGDQRVLRALFRDYCFLASAYLLEPCYERKCKGLEGYGLGRQSLPGQVARPLVMLADV